MKLIDSHCHLCHGRLRGQIDDVLVRARCAGVVAAICATGDLEESAAATELANNHAGIYCTAGIHPHDAKDAPRDYLQRVRTFAEDPRNVAIGEIGLDYHYCYSPPHDQRRVFSEQLELAIRLGKKIVIHTREALDDTIGILSEADAPGENIVFHSCSEPPGGVRRILETGAMVSFSGIVTFTKAAELREAAKLVPRCRLLIETDAPFLSPVPVRKMRTNEPANVVHVATCLGALHGLRGEELAELTTANAVSFFALPAVEG